MLDFFVGFFLVLPCVVLLVWFFLFGSSLFGSSLFGSSCLKPVEGEEEDTQQAGEEKAGEEGEHKEEGGNGDGDWGLICVVFFSSSLACCVCNCVLCVQLCVVRMQQPNKLRKATKEKVC